MNKTIKCGNIKTLAFSLVALVTSVASALTVPTPTASKGTYSGSIKISWYSVTGATKYQVRYSTSSSYSSSSALKTQTGTTLTVTGVTAGRTYYFWVCPYDKSGSRWYNTSKYASGYSRQSTRVTVSASSSTSYNRVSWSVSGSSPSAFRVYRSPINNYSYATHVATGGSSARSYTDRSATGATYYYWVVYNLNGTWYRVGSVAARRTTVNNGSYNDGSGAAYISGSSSLRYGSSAKYYLYVGGKKVSATWSRSGQATMQSKGSYGLLKATNKPISTFSVTVRATYKGRTYSKSVKITR